MYADRSELRGGATIKPSVFHGPTGTNWFMREGTGQAVTRGPSTPGSGWLARVAPQARRRLQFRSPAASRMPRRRAARKLSVMPV
jgi:hypothetical protein